jgi:3-methyladenine DNA glycosylase AlkD
VTAVPSVPVPDLEAAEDEAWAALRAAGKRLREARDRVEAAQADMRTARLERRAASQAFKRIVKQREEQKR